METININKLHILIDIKNSPDVNIIIPSTLNTIILTKQFFPFKKAQLKAGDHIVVKFIDSKLIDGFVCKVENIDILGEDTAKLVLFPLRYIKIKKEIDYHGYYRVKVNLIEFGSISKQIREKAFIEIMRKKGKEIIKYLKGDIPVEFIMAMNIMDNPFNLSELLLSVLPADNKDKLSIMVMMNIDKRINQVIKLAESCLLIMREKEKIALEVQKSIAKNQKNYFLNEQLKVIKREIGYSNNVIDESEALKEKIEEANLPEYAQEKALRELNKLSTMAPTSPESTVIRNYLDWIINIPWYKTTSDNLNINLAEKILHRNHYGLNTIKERVLEFLSVMKLTGKIKGQIICFVGPPGVGKTSLGQSIAESMGREFVRISLGGIRDEAEIRGHRKTYIGSLPGKIIQMMRRANVINPVFMLDEVDKLGSDFKGDPASALLEVLDPQLNHSFMDHYLEVEYNLSDVLFICTANIIHTIPPALRDRMEIINLPGYPDYEKQKISKKFLIPKSLKNTGLIRKDIEIKDEAIKVILRDYVLEAGVRNLEKSINKIMRKVAKGKASGKLKRKRIINGKNLSSYLGPSIKRGGLKNKKNIPGLVNGLAWTQFGGTVLTVETLIVPGTGKIHLTGQLGDVLKESAKTAISYIRKFADKYKIDPDFHKKSDIHIHLLEGAIPKDGPSAGITIAVSLYSSLLKKSVKRSFAMTGEISLNGIILPIGGLAEKIVAAQSMGIENVIIPYDNKPLYDHLPKESKKKIKIFFIKTIDDAVKLLFN